jgi:hypothetical protein
LLVDFQKVILQVFDRTSLLHLQIENYFVQKYLLILRCLQISWSHQDLRVLFLQRERLFVRVINYFEQNYQINLVEEFFTHQAFIL